MLEHLLVVCLHEVGCRLAVESEVILRGHSNLLVRLLDHVLHGSSLLLVSEIVLLVQILVHLVQLAKDRCVERLQELGEGAQLGVLAKKFALGSLTFIFLFDVDSVEVSRRLDTRLDVLQREAFFYLQLV